jgi:hypothetical protein
MALKRDGEARKRRNEPLGLGMFAGIPRQVSHNSVPACYPLRAIPAGTRSFQAQLAGCGCADGRLGWDCRWAGKRYVWRSANGRCRDGETGLRLREAGCMYSN